MEGAIPESFFRLTNLLVLGLDDNLLESPLAPFAQFVNMEKMYLEGRYPNLCTCFLKKYFLSQMKIIHLNPRDDFPNKPNCI